jgi:hypothetical protein
MKTLRRRCIIRETDFPKVRRKAFTPLSFGETVSVLYDRAEWMPITRESIERDMILKGLRGKMMPRGGSWLIPEDYVLYSQDSLYDARYKTWRAGWDEEGYMTIQSRSNARPVRLGWAVFEKDLHGGKDT